MTNEGSTKRPWFDALPYSAVIKDLPEIDASFPGVRGWLLQGDSRQVVFFDIEAIGAVLPHKHGEQWGVVLAGEMKLTVEGVTHHLRPGDWYHIPAGAMHSAEFLSRFQAIDVFADRDRYAAKR